YILGEIAFAAIGKNFHFGLVDKQHIAQQIVLQRHVWRILSGKHFFGHTDEGTSYLIGKNDELLIINTNNTVVHGIDDGFNPAFFKKYAGKVAVLVLIKLGGHLVKGFGKVAKLIFNRENQALIIVFVRYFLYPLHQLPN